MPHTFANLRYHLVFSTKGRLPLIVPKIRDRLYHYIGGIIREHGGLMTEIGGIEDHIHILTHLRPRFSVSEILQKIKGSSSFWLNKQKLSDQRFSWQAGYAAFSVSESQVAAVRRYIQRQPALHRKMSFKEEIEKLLQRHEIAYAKSDLD